MELVVNGAKKPVPPEPRRSLLRVLREDLGLTGAKPACGEGTCGACSVLVDGRVTRSCVTPAAAVAGRRVVTIEGLAQDARLHPLQEAFLEAEALQCGYCTPGMIIAGVGLLTTNPDPSDEEIIAAMHGNLCRCGSYLRIVTAIRRAACAVPEARA
jgi:nicotinate dehydrogenase subunit A